MHPLTLDVNFEGWKIFAARKGDMAFMRFCYKIWERDNYTCQFCGFKAKEHLEVINLDRNYYNNKMSNLVTACGFCAQCFFLDAVGVTDFGGGLLIYLPEVSQNDVNSFCHVIFQAIETKSSYSGTAESIYRNLKFRSQWVDKEIGEGCNEPAAMGRALLHLEYTENLGKWERILKDIRLLPSRTRFKKQIAQWAKIDIPDL